MTKWTTGLLILLVLLSTGCKKSLADHMRNGGEYYQAGRYQEALIAYRNATTLAPQSPEARYELGRTYLALGNIASALADFQGTLELKPDHIDSQLQIATIHLSLGEYEKASPLINRVLKQNPKNATAHSLDGQYLIHSGKFDEGLKQLETAVTLSPSQVELYEPLATFHTGQGRSDQALAVLQKAVDLNPKSIPAILNLAQFLFQRRDVSGAERETRKALALDNRHLKSNLFLAQILTVTSRQKEAESVLTSVKATSPSDPTAYRALSVFYETTGQREKAIAELKSLETTQFRDLVVKQRLVENLLTAGRLDEAEATNRAIKKAASQSAHPYYTEGRIAMARQQFEAAIAPLNQAIAIEPQPEYYYSLGMAQASTGLTKQARDSFQQAIALDPSKVDAILALAGLALGSGNQSFALQTTGQILNRYPNSSEAKVVRAQALLATGQSQQGETILEEVLGQNPFELPALGLLLDLKVTQGKSAEMQQRLQALLAKQPSTPELHLLLGIARYANKDFAGSEASLREAIRLKPTIRAAHQVLASLLLEKGNRPEAKKALQAAIAADPANLANYFRLEAEHEKDNNMTEALAVFAAARKVDPSSPLLANHYAYLLLETGGDINLALALAQQAKEKMPASPDVADTLGWAYHKRGMHDQAVRQFTFAIQSKPEEPEYHYHLGQTYIALKNWPAARKALGKSLEAAAFPDKEKAQAALKGLAR